MKKIILPILLLIFIACKNDNEAANESKNSVEQEQQMTILTKIAEAYGYQNWDRVENVNFSFVVNPGENEKVRRWEWSPKADRITLKNEDKSISFARGDLTEDLIGTDKAFVNDSFWLLFPFHLVWDNIEYEVQENNISPINKQEATKLIVKYPPEGGYTPGDKYEVYVNNDYHIIEWTYHPKGQDEAALANTFEDLSNFSGITVNMIHRNPESGFQLNFRDVSFK